MFGFSASSADPPSARLARIEAKLDLILDHLDIERDKPSPSGLDRPSIERIREVLHSRGKIEAIKLHRELTGAGLKESKHFVESL